MVRFIIKAYNLDTTLQSLNLHSTMVRFIMKFIKIDFDLMIGFTFHYGQIYYIGGGVRTEGSHEFTFHYGQIYYIRTI